MIFAHLDHLALPNRKGCAARIRSNFLNTRTAISRAYPSDCIHPPLAGLLKAYRYTGADLTGADLEGTNLKDVKMDERVAEQIREFNAKQTRP